MEGLLVEAAVRTFRAVACATGALVAFDSLAIILLPQERPPHDPKLNALAWLVAGLGTALAAGWLLWSTFGSGDGSTPLAAVACVWGSLSTAFTIRAATRAPRPYLVVASSLLFTVVGIGFSIADRFIR